MLFPSFSGPYLITSVTGRFVSDSQKSIIFRAEKESKFDVLSEIPTTLALGKIP